MLPPLLGLLAPPACLSCRAPGATPLCGACRRALRWLAAEDPCPRCALPRAPGAATAWGTAAGPAAAAGWQDTAPPPLAAAAATAHRTHRCPAADAPWRAAYAPVAYAGPAADLVAALKLRGALPCARLMAAQLVAGAPPGLLDGGAALVPVPTHPARARRRGYDQAVVLARAVRSRTGLPLAVCLRRTGAATHQRGAGRADRLQPGRLTLSARGPAPPRVVLVDDVHTTGATLRAGVDAVRAAGARDVVVMTWARTL